MIIFYTIIFKPLSEYIPQQHRFATTSDACDGFHQAIADIINELLQILISLYHAILFFCNSLQIFQMQS